MSIRQKIKIHQVWYMSKMNREPGLPGLFASFLLASGHFPLLSREGVGVRQKSPVHSSSTSAPPKRAPRPMRSLNLVLLLACAARAGGGLS